MSASISFDSSAFCNRSLLFGQLKLEMPPVSGREPVASPEMVTNALCTLSVTEDFKFNNQILNQLVIRKLTNNVSVFSGLFCALFVLITILIGFPHDRWSTS